MALVNEILNLLAAGPASSSELAARLGVTRQAVHHQLKLLERSGEVERRGKARATRWWRRYEHRFSWPLSNPDGSVPAEHEMWADAWGVIQASLPGLSAGARSALAYGATEVLNNAIDHSGGRVVTLSSQRQSTDLELVIADDGIGALAHVQQRFGLPSPLDAIVHIAKGRQPTDPTRHSGEGLFFTSKIFDHFELDANGHAWKVDNVRHDMTVAPGAAQQGTRVTLQLDLNTTRSPREVFEMSTDPDSLAVTSNLLRVSLADH
jgi:anti-sigma regulatory factor (Ser/Thr protein kinase)